MGINLISILNPLLVCLHLKAVVRVAVFLPSALNHRELQWSFVKMTVYNRVSAHKLQTALIS